MNGTVTNHRASENHRRSWEGDREASGHRDRDALLTIKEVDNQLLKNGVAIHNRSALKQYFSTPIDKGM